MSAWSNLLAASSLSGGTAWNLLNNPKIGIGTIINTGAYVEVIPSSIRAEVSMLPYTISIYMDSISTQVSTLPIQVSIPDTPLTIGVIL